MANEIDLLWQKIDEDPSLITAPELDTVIAYYRKLQSNHSAGIKTKKSGEPKVEIDLVALGLVKKPEPIKRRF